MTRYFTQFRNARPLKEIDEAETHRRDFYAEEVDDVPLRYRCYVHDQLDRVVYPGWTDPAVPLADFRARREGVRGEIYSPAENDGDTVRWRTWYVDPSGEIVKILAPVHGTADGRFLTEHHCGPDGELRSYGVYHYDEDDELREVVNHAPDGTVINRERS